MSAFEKQFDMSSLAAGTVLTFSRLQASEGTRGRDGSHMTCLQNGNLVTEIDGKDKGEIQSEALSRSLFRLVRNEMEEEDDGCCLLQCVSRRRFSGGTIEAASAPPGVVRRDWWEARDGRLKIPLELETGGNFKNRTNYNSTKWSALLISKQFPSKP